MKRFAMILAVLFATAVSAEMGKTFIFSGVVKAFDDKTVTILTEKNQKIKVPRAGKLENPEEGKEVTISVAQDEFMRLNMVPKSKKKAKKTN